MLKIKSSKTKVDIKDFLRKRLLTESLSVSSWSPALLPKKNKEKYISKIIKSKKKKYVLCSKILLFTQNQLQSKF